MKQPTGNCQIELGSMTAAMKAQTALSHAAIPSTVIKLEASSRHGCSYGLSFSCLQEQNVRTVLSANRISVKKWGGTYDIS